MNYVPRSLLELKTGYRIRQNSVGSYERLRADSGSPGAAAFTVCPHLVASSSQWETEELTVTEH